MFLIWNDTCAFISILNIFNIPRILIHIYYCLLWFNIFPLTSPVTQSDSGAESYGPLKLVGS
jgi:hypothetical protein